MSTPALPANSKIASASWSCSPGVSENWPADHWTLMGVKAGRPRRQARRRRARCRRRRPARARYIGMSPGRLSAPARGDPRRHAEDSFGFLRHNGRRRRTIAGMTTHKTPDRSQAAPDTQSTNAGSLVGRHEQRAGEAVAGYADMAREPVDAGVLIDEWAEVQTESLMRELLARPRVCFRSVSFG